MSIGSRPWDFEQQFEVSPDGETAPLGDELGDGYGKLVNRQQFLAANAVERLEVATLAEAARERHHGQHVSGCHECATWRHREQLSDVPWSHADEATVPRLTNESTGYPPVRQAFTGHLGEP